MSEFRKLARYNRQAAPNRLLLHYLSVFANSMPCEFTRELACILWIGIEVQTANRTFVLTTPTASAITNYHDGPQAHFLDCHVRAVQHDYNSQTRSGSGTPLLAHNDARLWSSPGKSRFRKLAFGRYERADSQFPNWMSLNRYSEPEGGVGLGVLFTVPTICQFSILALSWPTSITSSI